MTIKEHKSTKFNKVFPDGIRIGTKAKINYSDGGEKYTISKAINPFCSSESLHRDGSGRTLDMYHYHDQDAYTGEQVKNGCVVPNGSEGVVSYMYVGVCGEPFFHLYIEKLDATVFVGLSEFGIYDEYEEENCEESRDENSNISKLN